MARTTTVTPLGIRRCINIEGWEGFPVPDLWDPFHPHLTVAFDLSRGGCVYRGLFEEYGTERLDHALKKLAAETWSRVIYSALPVKRVAEVERTVNPELLGAPWQLIRGSHLFAYELQWPAMRRGRNAPTRIENAGASLLWDETYACHAYFTVERDFRGGPIRLTVGGSSSSDCVRTWTLVARWMRTALRLVEE